jgi:hypothetical protein
VKDAAGRTLGRADEPERVRRGAPPVRPGRGVDGPDEPLGLLREPDDALVASPGVATGASMAAMRELANAFQANAQALRQAQTVQSELSRALKRGDRADMVLQSTNALNETFRNLVAVQKRLLERLEEPPPPPVGSRLVPMMLVALLVVFLGGIAGVLHVIQTMREERVDPLLLAREMDASRDKGRSEAEAALATRTQQQDQRVAEAEARLAELEAKTTERERELEELRRSKAALESEQHSLADEALRLRDEAVVRRAIESELSSANARLAVLEPRLQQLEGELVGVRNERLRLQKRIATERMGIAPVEEGGERTPAADAVTPDAAAARDPVSRDARQIDAVQAAVNRLLERGLRARGEYWQMARLGGVSADRLHEVVLHRYDARGKLLDGVEGSEVVIHLDRNRGVVEFEVRRGAALFDGVRTPFQGALHRIVDEGPEALSQWSGSGLLMVRGG